jgi:hypothetical protein
MRFSDERIDEFIRLYEQAGGGRLSRDAARIRAGQLIALYLMLMPPSVEQKISAQTD